MYFLFPGRWAYIVEGDGFLKRGAYNWNFTVCVNGSNSFLHVTDILNKYDI